jgi:hypothetical protein
MIQEKEIFNFLSVFWENGILLGKDIRDELLKRRNKDLGPLVKHLSNDNFFVWRLKRKLFLLWQARTNRLR